MPAVSGFGNDVCLPEARLVVSFGLARLCFFFPHIDSSDARQTGRVSVLKGTVLLNVAAKSVLVQIKQN